MIEPETLNKVAYHFWIASVLRQFGANCHTGAIRAGQARRLDYADSLASPGRRDETRQGRQGKVMTAKARWQGQGRARQRY
jgi:hypothetical protein